MIHTILVPLAEGLPGEPVLNAALSLDKQVNSHIRAVYIRPDSAVAAAYVPDVILAAGGTLETIEREANKAAAAEKDRFDKWREKHDMPAPASEPHDGPFATWSESAGEIETVVSRYARVSDLTVVHRPSSKNIPSQRCFDAAVFGSGCPTLVVSDWLPPNMTEHIMIAWNGSLEASRAVSGALPLLHRAGRISIFAAPLDETENADVTDLSESLAFRGIRPPEVVFSKSGHSAGADLVAAAIQQRATLIVMGAYTHSRLRQTFLGGVTKHLLAHSPVPLLVSH
jgi:nucleotide-binding universal stress UspA family protein